MNNNNWISVNDRLPEEGNEFLTYNSDTKVYDIIYFHINEGTWNSIGEKPREITHWKSLPEPPCSI